LCKDLTQLLRPVEEQNEHRNIDKIGFHACKVTKSQAKRKGKERISFLSLPNGSNFDVIFSSSSRKFKLQLAFVEMQLVTVETQPAIVETQPEFQELNVQDRRI
jgi:hypothetical protein